jgi:acyl-CoA thioester hydrolase
METNKRLMFRRQRRGYFETDESAPPPVKVRIQRCVNFSEVDAMGIVWHGNYPKYFEAASAELGRKCGLSYRDYYRAKVHAPIVQLHVDYHRPVVLEEIIDVEARYIWSEGSRLYTEFVVYGANERIAVTGYTIQMFVDSLSREPLLTSPEIFEECRKRWNAGEFHSG